MRDELAKGLETLLELRGSFDYILIETTGMRVTTRCGLKGNRLTGCVWSRGTADKLAPCFDRATQVWPILGQSPSRYG